MSVASLLADNNYPVSISNMELVQASGYVVLNGGTETVAYPIGANDVVILTDSDPLNAGQMRVSSRSVGGSFTITSSNGADVGVVNWMVIKK